MHNLNSQEKHELLVALDELVHAISKSYHQAGDGEYEPMLVTLRNCTKAIEEIVRFFEPPTE